MISEMTQFTFWSKLESCTFLCKMYRVHSSSEIRIPSIFKSTLYNLYQKLVTRNFCNKLGVHKLVYTQMYRRELSIGVKLPYTIDVKPTTRIFVMKKLHGIQVQVHELKQISLR